MTGTDGGMIGLGKWTGPGWFRGLIAAGWVALAAAPAAAQDVMLALDAGHPDLALYALSRTEARISELGEGLLQVQGFFHDPEGPVLQPLAQGHALTPTLRHDSNINDGIPSDHITIGGLRFNVTEESRAKDALLAGLQYTRWDRFSFGRAARLNLTQVYLAELEPTYGYDHLAATIRLCAERPARDWTWIDACLTGSYDDDGIDRDIGVTGQIGARTLFGTGLGFHQASASFARAAAGDYEKSLLQFGLSTLTPRHGLFALTLIGGERIEGQNTLRYYAGLDWTGDLMGKQVSFGVSQARTDGAALFGMARVDDISRLSLTVPVGKLDLGGFVERRRSTIDAYDGIDVGLTFNMRFDLLGGS